MLTLGVSLSSEAQSLIERLGSADARLLQAVQRGLYRANQRTMSEITLNRMSGKGPFPVSQNRLGEVESHARKSLTTSRPVIHAGAVVSSIGSNVGYVAVHEFGFKGVATVKKHLRKAPLGDRFNVGGQTVTGRSLGRAGRQRRRKDQISSRVSFVKQHTRKMEIPARKFIRTGIEENDAIYSSELSDALERVLG
jgi:phage gpG-like protein